MYFQVLVAFLSIKFISLAYQQVAIQTCSLLNTGFICLVASYNVSFWREKLKMATLYQIPGYSARMFTSSHMATATRKPRLGLIGAIIIGWLCKCSRIKTPSILPCYNYYDGKKGVQRKEVNRTRSKIMELTWKRVGKGPWGKDPESSQCPPSKCCLHLGYRLCFSHYVEVKNWTIMLV